MSKQSQAVYHYNRRRARQKMKRSALPVSKPMDSTLMSSLEDTIAKAGVPDTWDVMIVGDGSGCWWDKPCAWGCTLIDRHLGRRRAFYGGLSSGSIAIAELMPAVHAMLWYAEFQGKVRRAQLRRGSLNIHIITDNETTSLHWAILTAGGQRAQKLRKKRPLWNVLLQLERSGYIFHFHWIARDTVGLNKVADKVAGITSKVIPEVEVKFEEKYKRSLDHEIYMVDASA
jgi:hypothetical protein